MQDRTMDELLEATMKKIEPDIEENPHAALEEHLAGGRQAIDERLSALDREYGVERALEAGAAAITVAGTALGAFVNRRFLILPAVVAGFLVQHAIQGRCLPHAALRALGFRTAHEIEEERYALKAARGDFVGLVGRREAGSLLDAVRS